MTMRQLNEYLFTDEDEKAEDEGAEIAREFDSPFQVPDYVREFRRRKNIPEPE